VIAVARLEWVAVAQGYSVDRESNALSIFNVIESLAVQKEVPDPPRGQQFAIGPQFVIVHRWIRSDPELEERPVGRVRVVGPEGDTLGTAEFTVDLLAERRARSMLKFPFFPFVGIGEYKFFTEMKVGDDWQEIDKMALVVHRVASEGAPAAPIP
jgi:hypothetical protein